jgi:hypothetical protein
LYTALVNYNTKQHVKLFFRVPPSAWEQRALVARWHKRIPCTGKYRVREGHLPRFGFTVSRADVADFMIKVVENRSSIGKIVGVCN